MTEAATVSPAPEPPPSSPEAAKGPEVRKLSVLTETKAVTSNLIFGKVREVGQSAREKVVAGIDDWKEAHEGEEPSPDDLKDLQENALTKADQLFLNLERIEGLGQDADGAPQGESFVDEDKPNGESLQGDGNPVLIKKDDGTVVELTHLQSAAADGTVTCLSKDGDEYEEVQLSKSELGQAVLTAEKDLVMDAFAGDPNAQKVVEAYVTAIDPTNDKDLEPSAELDNALESVAADRGMLTTSAVESFFSHTPDDIRNSAEAKSLLGRLEGKVVLSAEDIGSVFAAAGFTQESVDNQIISVGGEIAELQAAVERTQDEGAKEVFNRRIAAKQEEQKVYRTMGDVLSRKGDDNPIEVYADAVFTGKMDQEAAKQVLEAFKSGDIEGILGGIMDTVDELKVPAGATDEEKQAIHDKRKEIAKNVAKWGGKGVLGVGILALILAAAGAAITVGAAGAAMKGQR